MIGGVHRWDMGAVGPREDLRRDWLAQQEALRQQLSQSASWFRLRLLIGYVAVALVIGVAGVSAFILLNASTFPAVAVASAAVAELSDVLGVVGGVFWAVMNRPGPGDSDSTGAGIRDTPPPALGWVLD